MVWVNMSIMEASLCLRTDLKLLLFFYDTLVMYMTFPFYRKNVKFIWNRMVLYKHMIHTKYSSLVISDLLWKCAPLPVIHQQCGFLTSIFSGDLCLRSEYEMNVSIDDETKCLINDGMPLWYFHSYFDKQWLYMKELANLLVKIQVSLKSYLNNVLRCAKRIYFSMRM